jgi:hypothetical protein
MYLRRHMEKIAGEEYGYWSLVEYMRQKGARHLVGIPKAMLKKFEQQLLCQDWEGVQSGVEVRLCPLPDSQSETFVLCRSQGRREKENAILNRFVQNMEAVLAKMEASMISGKLQDRQKAKRRIGRLQERNSRAASLFTITITETGTEKEKKFEMTVHKNEDRYRQILENGGYYLLRTNWTQADPKTIWKTYIQLTEVEDAFRTAKQVRLRVVSTAPKELKVLLQRIKALLPSRPKIIENVVQEID